jgi:hypothetical protein
LLSVILKTNYLKNYKKNYIWQNQYSQGTSHLRVSLIGLNVDMILWKVREISMMKMPFCIFTMVFTINTDNIYASEKKKSPLRIVMNLNDFSSVSNAKEALIDSLIDYNMYPELAGHINYEASELKTTSLNLSKAGQQRTAVQLVIKTNHQLSENKLFKEL